MIAVGAFIDDNIHAETVISKQSFIFNLGQRHSVGEGVHAVEWQLVDIADFLLAVCS